MVPTLVYLLPLIFLKIQRVRQYFESFHCVVQLNQKLQHFNLGPHACNGNAQTCFSNLLQNVSFRILIFSSETLGRKT